MRTVEGDGVVDIGSGCCLFETSRSSWTAVAPCKSPCSQTHKERDMQVMCRFFFLSMNFLAEYPRTYD